MKIVHYCSIEILCLQDKCHKYTYKHTHTHIIANVSIDSFSLRQGITKCIINLVNFHTNCIVSWRNGQIPTGINHIELIIVTSGFQRRNATLTPKWNEWYQGILLPLVLKPLYHKQTTR